MAQEESKQLKETVKLFSEENLGLKNLVDVLQADTSKMESLEENLTQIQTLYTKEKELNAQLLSGTGDTSSQNQDNKLEDREDLEEQKTARGEENEEKNQNQNDDL